MRHAFERINVRLRANSPNQDPVTRLALLKRIVNRMRSERNERVDQRRGVSEVRKQQQPAAPR